ncbi:TAZ family protein [Megaselia abdita]
MNFLCRKDSLELIKFAIRHVNSISVYTMRRITNNPASTRTDDIMKEKLQGSKSITSHSKQSNSNNTSTSPPNPPGEQTLLEYSIDWIYPRLKRPSAFWHFASVITIAAVGIFSKLILVFFNKTKIYNRQRLVDLVGKRSKGTPLVTISNHHSCFDDPGLWGTLPFRTCCSHKKIRWSLAAHDICFTNKYHSLFFMFGKCIPVIRGAGVYQPAVDLCIQKLNLGDWVHIFPEGKVNMTKEFLRYKWGIGRIIYESTKIPIILPVYHLGMDDVLPNVEPYIFKTGRNVVMNIGKPIDLSHLILDLKDRNVPEPEARKIITDALQNEMEKLRVETEGLHYKYNNNVTKTST